MLSSLILCLIVMTFSRQTTASHFRGGIITWKPGGNNSNKVKDGNYKGVLGDILETLYVSAKRYSVYVYRYIQVGCSLL